MKLHTTALNGRTIEYFQAYESDYTEMWLDAYRKGQLCVVVGPTGIGKTTFLDYVAAEYYSSKVLNVMVYGIDDCTRVVNIASTMTHEAFLSIAFYPNPSTWLDTTRAIDIIIDDLTKRNLILRLAGLELSVESEFVDIIDAISTQALARRWCLLHFKEWDENQQLAYMDYLTGFNRKEF